MSQNATFLGSESSKKYFCEYCDYSTSRYSQFQRHNLTLKHKMQQNATYLVPSDDNAKNSKEYKCKCGNVFGHRTTLWRHKKKCINKEEKDKIFNEEQYDNNDSDSDNDNDDLVNDFSGSLNELLSIENFMELMKQNQEFKELLAEQNKQLLEQNKMIIDLAKNGGSHTINSNNNINSNNKTFNLQVFLNEKCKDAMNIDEFVDSLKLTFNDLENVGELGFVKGISRIFINGLRELDVYKRPIHCSDLKREVIHLKADGVWEKDNENKDIMKKLVKMIANKNISKIYEWREAYPNHRYSDDPKNDIYLKIAYQSMGARSKEEDIVYYEKVIKNVAKEVTINKSIF